MPTCLACLELSRCGADLKNQDLNFNLVFEYVSAASGSS